MPKRTYSLFELMAQEETRRMEQARQEIAAEKAAWDAMTPDEQNKIIAAREAKYSDSSWSRPIGENLAGLAGDSEACVKCDAIHDAGKFTECQVCGGEGHICDDCELPIDICDCDEKKD